MAEASTSYPAAATEMPRPNPNGPADDTSVANAAMMELHRGWCTKVLALEPAINGEKVGTAGSRKDRKGPPTVA